MAIRLKELAQHLGLSQTTVSRALNGYPEVSMRTRSRVAEAAAHYDYHPNSNAQNLAKGRSGSIGIVFQPERKMLLEPLFADYLAGVAETTALHDLAITLSTPSSDREEEAYRRAAAALQVDGLLLSSPKVEDKRLRILAETNIPFILHGRTVASAPYAFLDIDNEGAFFAATKLLIDLGHRRIALLNAEIDYTFACHREAGFRRAVGGVSDPTMKAWSLEGQMTDEYGYRNALACLQAPRRPTAFVCASTLMVPGVMRAAREFGLQIGRDLALIAHDDRISQLRPDYFDPPLSTTQSSIRDAGRRVAEMLIARIGGAAIEDLQEIWTPELVVRGSTPPPLQKD
ncbi:substrate-binding domain-containing protein [Methylovirgula sp. 4M-Z18]|uniref:substrate-binding domain-containing protein n=1 Tax=Methylovirgula sp. 4M-Z18 TaxID=2293567 RepID=UPI000E2E6371|nr:substrate-binding domain-containing protein [Methylovirgula sp. 4M-Z18]RFB78725.1 LacI family transcriptional regulator [Methylovirgula sp. 4M-Z18]